MYIYKFFNIWGGCGGGGWARAPRPAPIGATAILLSYFLGHYYYLCCYYYW